MINCKCNNAVSINIKAGDIAEIEFPSIARANIVNYTDGAIFVSENNDFNLNESGQIGNYLTITDGNAYNEYIFYKKDNNKLYIKADADGYICVIRKIW